MADEICHLKSNIFIFPIAEIAANYEEVGKVDKLKAGFKQNVLVQIF